MASLRRSTLFIVALLLAGPSPATGATIPVAAGQSIQAAIVAASDGDTILVAPGIFAEDLDFLGKALEVIGAGSATVVKGTGTGPVVRFTTGETAGSILDSVAITGGRAELGGGILIMGTSPTVIRNVIVDNRATSRGSGIYVEGSTAAPLIANNVIMYNTQNDTGDPHAIQTSSSSPVILNNTIVKNDSNGILVSGGGSAIVRNNILGKNGSRGSKSIPRRGRGICNFSANTVIDHNVFFRNAKAALLQAGQDYRRIRGAERRLDTVLLFGNTDRSPKFVRRRLARSFEEASPADFELRPTSRALHAGNPDPAYANPDGSRNTIGHRGGPLSVGP